MASINKLASGKWRVQVRCKGLYLSNSFSLRKAEMWAGRIEREIDLGQKPAPKHKDGIKTVSDLIDLHIADMEEVGKEIGRSTGFSLDLLRARLGKLKIADLNREQVKERPELERRRLVYRGTRKPLSITGKTAIIVDDGAATGATMKVAIRAIKRRSPGDIIAAIPVTPPEAVAELAQEADRVVCLCQPVRFHALGYHYLGFPQLTDADVASALQQASQQRGLKLRSGRNRITKSPRLQGMMRRLSAVPDLMRIMANVLKQLMAWRALSRIGQE